MEKFINVKDVPKNKVKISDIDAFIKQMNKGIRQGVFSMNNALDNFKTLSDEEYQIAFDKAFEAGWMLTRFEDNYNSTTYRISPLEENDN